MYFKIIPKMQRVEEFDINKGMFIKNFYREDNIEAINLSNL